MKWKKFIIGKISASAKSRSESIIFVVLFVYSSSISDSLRNSTWFMYCVRIGQFVMHANRSCPSNGGSVHSRWKPLDLIVICFEFKFHASKGFSTEINCNCVESILISIPTVPHTTEEDSIQFTDCVTWPSAFTNDEHQCALEILRANENHTIQLIEKICPSFWFYYKS